MHETTETCKYELAYGIEFRNIKEDLGELKTRVARLESQLAHGVALLVANLAGVIIMLARQLLAA